jgi:hypothetical protein
MTFSSASLSHIILLSPPYIRPVCIAKWCKNTTTKFKTYRPANKGTQLGNECLLQNQKKIAYFVWGLGL